MSSETRFLVCSSLTKSIRNTPKWSEEHSTDNKKREGNLLENEMNFLMILKLFVKPIHMISYI